MALISCELVHVMPQGWGLGGKRNTKTGKETCPSDACLQPFTGCWRGRGFSNQKGKCSSETGKWNFLLSINNGKLPLQWLCVESLAQEEHPVLLRACLGPRVTMGGLMLAQTQGGRCWGFGGIQSTGGIVAECPKGTP